MSDKSNLEIYPSAQKEQIYLLDESPVAVFVMMPEPDFQIIHISKSISDITKYSPDQFINDKNFWISKIDEDHREYIQNFITKIDSESSDSITYKFLCGDDRFRWMESRINKTNADNGDVTYLIGTIMDIDNYQIAYEILKAREELYRVAAYCSNDIIYELNIATGEKQWYSDVDQALKYKPGEFPRTIEAWKQSLHPNDVDRVMQAMEEHIADPEQPFDQEYMIRAKDGKYRIWIDRGQLLVRDNIRTDKLIGSCTDITKSKQEYLQVQKMETVGRLAGGIAHDFNNLLTAIIGFSDMALQAKNIDSNCRTYVNEIKNAGELASSLTRQLLAFSRKQVFNLECINLNVIVTKAETLLRRLISKNTRLELKLDEELYNTNIDSSQIQQVIMNLCLNANDAMPQGGTLSIKTYNVFLDKRFSDLYPEIIPGDYVALSIKDDGKGISSEDLSRIFEPFFTTKGKGKGTGLGLSTVYGIIKQSNGYIYAFSEVDKGTEFRIFLPVAQDEIKAHEKINETEIISEGDENILLVEDEPMVRMLAETALTQKGYDMLVAANGEDALKIFNAHSKEIKLLVTDVIMPGMNGVELAKKLVENNPALKVIFMSGYSDDIITSYGAQVDGVILLEKPFAPADLTKLVRSVLDNKYQKN